MLLKDKVALVTGGASGIGEATVKCFAREGASVAVADIDSEKGDLVARMVRENGGNAFFMHCDVAKVSEIERLVSETVSRFGKLDCAFNNAGIEGDQCLTADCSESNWDRVINVNLKGVWLCMKYELQQMLPKKAGSIVNNSSVAGVVGFIEIPAYVASKHGIIGLTKSSALEYASSGIRINAVCPGVIRTPMVERITKNNPETEAAYVGMEPVGRMGTPDEIAEAVVWLCSEKASFVTGHSMIVDGGLVAG